MLCLQAWWLNSVHLRRESGSLTTCALGAEQHTWVLTQLGGKAIEDLGPLELKNALERVWNSL